MQLELIRLEYTEFATRGILLGETFKDIGGKPGVLRSRAITREVCSIVRKKN